MSNPITKCPKCGDTLVRKSYMKDGKEREFLAHEHYDKDAEDKCDFNFFLNFMGTKLSDKEVKELIENKKTSGSVKIEIPLKYVGGKVQMDFSGFKK